MAGVALAKLLRIARRAADEAQGIGRLPVSFDLTAMCVGYDGKRANELVYLGETPIRVAWAWRIMDHSVGERHRWWRLEVKVATANHDVQPGHHLVAAEHPYANGWSHHVAFKRRSKKGPDQRPTLSETIADPSALIQWIENLSCDFWEKGDCLTAGISEPHLPHCPGRAIRNTHRLSSLVLGVCHDFGACESALLSSEVVEQLLDQTERNIITFWYPKAPVRQRLKLYDTVIAERNQLMSLSIRQALAGPHEESDKWVGKTVTEKVGQVYRDHLNNLNRGEAGKVSRSCGFRDPPLD